MMALALVLGLVVVILAVGLFFARAELVVKTDQQARALTEAFAREAKHAAEKKAEAAANAAVEQLEGASHAELERIARDLASRR